MKKLTGRFDNLNRQVDALGIFAVVLFFLLAGYAIYLMYGQKVDDALKVSMPLAALVSALLVAKVASRLLEHNGLVREDDRRQEVVKITHHLLAVIDDLRNRIGYVVLVFREGNRPMIALFENVAVIEKRYEVFFDRDIYRYLNGETINLIGRMSGGIFGLTSFTKGVEKEFHGSLLINIPATETSKKISENLDLLLKDLDVLDGQIRQLRGTLEST